MKQNYIKLSAISVQKQYYANCARICSSEFSFTEMKYARETNSQSIQHIMRSICND